MPRVDSAGHALVNVSRAGQPSLALELQLDLTTASGEVAGTVSGAHWVATFLGERAGGSSVPAGKYTLVIPDAAGVLGDTFSTWRSASDALLLSDN